MELLEITRTWAKKTQTELKARSPFDAKRKIGKHSRDSIKSVIKQRKKIPYRISFRLDKVLVFRSKGVGRGTRSINNRLVVVAKNPKKTRKPDNFLESINQNLPELADNLASSVASQKVF